ncbi:hypothetical protein BDB01DRAFT_799509 [Pilobolus umbonatus]|nr:hypothetical protein BDB01DRAFT_799509 [Pilobolus umbonatus]
MRASILLLLSSIALAQSCSYDNTTCWPTTTKWNALDQTVKGNLISVLPAGAVCYFGEHYDKAKCDTYHKGFSLDLFRESQIGAMQYINWESCGHEQCTLVPYTSYFPFTFGKCSQGGLPRYALNATSEHDIAAAIQFSTEHRIPLNIKNSGHDFLGRSTSPDSLTIWTHHMKNIEYHETFQPDECDLVPPMKAMTLGAGIKWIEAYAAADKYNVTIIGGAQAGVGAVGGWLQGGGHGILTPAFGMGVDQVVQFKVVLADGTFITVNKCQHPDLFWALRGGGGGTFGVVTEATVKVYPPIDIQAFHINVFVLSPGALKNLLAEYTRHSERWIMEGWGGYFYYYGYRVQLLMGNPLLTKEEAKESLKPFVEYLNTKKWSYYKKLMVFETFHGFHDLFIKVMNNAPELVGISGRIASRLVPRSNFATDKSRSKLVNAIIRGISHTRPLSFFVPTQMLMVTSPRVTDTEGETSVHPTFRDSVWHVVYTTGWIKGYPESVKSYLSKEVTKAIQYVRDITPGSGAYFNEADVLEPNWQSSFWGKSNYERLSKIKKDYDPTNVFNCWKCVGWKEDMIVTDDKYRCYQY